MNKKLFLLFLVLSMMMTGCAPTQPSAQAVDTAQVAPTSPAEVSPATAAVIETAVVTEPAAAIVPAAVSEEPITRALTSEPTGLDPHGAAGSGQNAILPFLFDTLVYRDLDNSVKPYLAERWEVAKDGKTITFFLKEGLTFQDGTPLDAAAVKFSFERLKANTKSPIAGGLADVEQIEAVDAATVRFVFSHPSSTFLSTVATPYTGVVSPKAAQESGDAFGQNPVGSGPYQLESWSPGISITLVRNPDYHWAPPVVSNPASPLTGTLVFKIIPDPSSQLTAFENGEVDILFVNQPGHVAKLKKDPNATVVETTLNSLIYLGFNSQKAPFDNVEVRQALSHAVNKEEVLQIALGGIGEVAFAPLAPTLPGFDPVLKSSELGYDPEKAKSLLQAAGFEQTADGGWAKDGVPLQVTLLTSTRSPNLAIATVLQAQYKAIGIPVEIQQLESQAAMDASSQGKFDLLLWRYDWNDADVLYTNLSTGRIGRTNRTFYSNPALDTLLEQALRSMNESERNALYLEAQQIILRDAPWQPLYTPKDFMAFSNKVDGVVVGPMGRLLLNDAVKNKP